MGKGWGWGGGGGDGGVGLKSWDGRAEEGEESGGGVRAESGGGGVGVIQGKIAFVCLGATPVRNVRKTIHLQILSRH